MCTRYILLNTVEQIESRFGLSAQNITLTPNYNISTGQFVPVITDTKPKEIQLMKFGLTPFWAKSEMVLINARSEGDYNKADDPGFRGATGIILKPAFRKPIRSQRCLVIASAFIAGVGDTGLSKPHLIYLRNHNNPFAMAGIWDTWVNPANGETLNSFSIITTSANRLMQMITQPRMPVILTRSEESRWLNPNTDLSKITQMLDKTDSKLMNAYPIAPRIRNSAENDRQLIKAVGEKILQEEELRIVSKPRSQGYHQAKRSHQGNEKTSTMAERIEQSMANDKASKDSLH